MMANPTTIRGICEVKNPKRHSIITLNLYGIRRPELAVLFQQWLDHMNDLDAPGMSWNLSVIEDVDSDEPQDGEETLDAMLGNEYDEFEQFLDDEGLS